MGPGIGGMVLMNFFALRSDACAPVTGAMISGTGGVLLLCADHWASDATPWGTSAKSPANGARNSSQRGSTFLRIAASTSTTTVLGRDATQTEPITWAPVLASL
ncbi:unnamed protein product [Caretta caretta]